MRRIMSSMRRLRRRVVFLRRGAVSIETILIIGAVALPVLIFLLKFGWPVIRDYFYEGSTLLELESNRVKHGG